MTPAPSAAPAAQIVVLGMHRSGTSALAGLLRLMGLWAGEEDDLPPADEHNPAGYWEHRGVWSVDEAILQTLGASWSEIADLDLSRLGEEARARFRERALEIVRDLDRHGSWFIKDPRLCLLFPFWREVLERPLCLLIHREPLPVARSLAARDGFSLVYGIALWERYTREMLASTHGVPRVLISHRELMADPAATLHRLHDHLVRHSPELARLHVLTAEEIRAVLDPALVHHPHEPEKQRLYLTPPQLDLLNALANGSALDFDAVPPLSTGARDLLAAYQGLLADIRRVSETVEVAERYAKSLLREKKRQERMLADAERYTRSLEAEREKLQRAHEQGAADLQRALSWAEELDAIVSAILDSRSWKIGRAITVMRRLFARPEISAPERRDRVRAEVRSWWRSKGA